MKNKKIKSNNEISELCSFYLGGYQQKVLIEGKSKDNPIVITLHGGPGTPIPFSVGCRGLFPVFTDEFIMVYWDQLGCGINNHVIDDSFSIDTFVQMTEELIEKIKDKFPNNKIMIFSTSWGSILSAKLLEKNPYAVDSVIACGQIIKNVFICDEVRDTLEQTSIPVKKLERIKNVTVDNYNGKDLQLISSALVGDDFLRNLSDIHIKLIFFFLVLFLRQFSDKGLEYIRTWIGDGVYGMSHSVDQSGTIESFLVQNIAQILADFIFIIPVTDVLF